MRNRILSGLLCLVLVLCLLPVTAGAYPDHNAASPATYDSPHVHTPSQWRITQPYHYKVCTTCGEFLEQEDHYGGTATCADPGVCVACGEAYLETTEDHIPDTGKWVARGDMYHFHKCKLCGAHCDIEDHRWSPKYHAVDASGHAYECADCHGYDKIKPHTPGPAATETTPQTCTVCGYIITPAKKHEHELARVPQTPADCTHGGNIEYYFCVGCSDCFTDAEAKNKIPENMSVEVGALGHTPSDTWGCDGEYHWRSCTVCSAVLDETRMLHEAADGKCTTCGYGIGSGSTAPNTEPSPTAPTEITTPSVEPVPSVKPALFEPPTPTNPGKKEGVGWPVAVMIGLVCFGAAVTATVIVLKKKK